MADLEKDLEHWAVEYCHSLGLRCEKLTGPVGWPDRTVFGPRMRGKTAYIEFKATRGRLSRAQQYWLKLLGGCGHPVLVPRTQMEVQRFLEQLVEDDEI